MTEDTKTVPELQFDTLPETSFWAVPKEFNILFHFPDTEEIGKFWFDEDEKRFKFTGECDHAASMFVESVTGYMNDWYAEKEAP